MVKVLTVQEPEQGDASLVGLDSLEEVEAEVGWEVFRKDLVVAVKQRW